MKKNYSIEFDKSISTVFVRIFGKTTKQAILDCFNEYEKTVEENYAENRFNILLNMDERAHDSIEVLRMVRLLFTNQKYKEYINAYAGVCENSRIIENRKIISSTSREAFFDNEKDAIEFLIR